MKEAEYDKIKKLLTQESVKRAMASRQPINKHWNDMNKVERKLRIRQLWSKVRLFVFLRRRLNLVRSDVEKRELAEMLN